MSDQFFKTGREEGFDKQAESEESRVSKHGFFPSL